MPLFFGLRSFLLSSFQGTIALFFQSWKFIDISFLNTEQQQTNTRLEELDDEGFKGFEDEELDPGGGDGFDEVGDEARVEAGGTMCSNDHESAVEVASV